jgi:hypothetical protein
MYAFDGKITPYFATKCSVDMGAVKAVATVNTPFHFPVWFK